MYTKRAIEETFPIVEINRLVIPERSAYKPIYQMHKWFARRASCVFRAILLGCLKPAGTSIMSELYKDHTNDPDTNGKVVFDPFMGGGTTVVEALRLGCKVIGVDLNPVAWFIVKTEVKPVNIIQLKAAFDRLANRIVPWSGKSVRDTLLGQYKTECPCCHREADSIYTFWVKSGICPNQNCSGRVTNKGREVPLFTDYIIVQKSPSIRYWRDTECPNCKKMFDWEVDPAVFVSESGLQVNASRSGGEGRSSTRWSFSAGNSVTCPWCSKDVKPTLKSKARSVGKTKKARKRVPLSVLLCPSCYGVWQFRGDLPDNVVCPVCAHSYNPSTGTMPEEGKFLCPDCGTKTATIKSVQRLPEDQRLPMRQYAIEGYCPHCANSIEAQDAQSGDGVDTDLFGELISTASESAEVDHLCQLTKNHGRFFKRISVADLAQYRNIEHTWELQRSNLPYPTQEIPRGEKTKTHLLGHHYRTWHDMFNSRHLLCLSTLLQAIGAERDQNLKELLLTAFFNTLNNVSDFCSYRTSVGALRQVFARHDFHPKNQPCENNVWGVSVGMGSFSTWVRTVVAGQQYMRKSWDYGASEYLGLDSSETLVRDPIQGTPLVTAANSANLSMEKPEIAAQSFDLVITDPPYASNVNYSELSDYFYVWLKLILGREYREFAPEQTPKVDEIVENPTRGKSNKDFEVGLTRVFKEAGRNLHQNGILAFTFHHREGSAWESLLSAVCNAGYEIVSVYPVAGEAESSLHISENEGSISYDLVHVCRKRDLSISLSKRSWAGIRQEIRRRAREEIRAIEAGRYGAEPLSTADANIVLIGKCLELYSRHYGAVIDHQDNPVPLHEALKEIRNLVDQLVKAERSLSSELEDIDAESRIYLLTLCDHKEIKSDDVHKATRGILEPDDLLQAGLMIKGRARGGRTYEVKQPIERLETLREIYQPVDNIERPTLFDIGPITITTRRRSLFVDELHLLLGLAESGDNLMPWLDRFSVDRPQIRAACKYLSERDLFTSACNKVLRLLDPGPLFQKGD